MVTVRVNSYFGMFDLGCLSNSDGSRGGRSTFLFNCGLRTKTGLRWLGLQIIDHQTTNNPGIEHKWWFSFPQLLTFGQFGAELQRLLGTPLFVPFAQLTLADLIIVTGTKK